MSRRRRPISGLGATLAALMAAGCENAMQDMYVQPRYDPLAPSTLFADGRSSRVPPHGVLAVLTGGFADATGGRRGAQVPPPAEPVEVLPILNDGRAAQSEAQPAAGQFPADLPIQVTPATYRRGRERFEIYCAPCHGVVGDGSGTIVQRGFPAPPSYHSDRLRDAPDRHFYDVITHGYGAMYPYAARVAPDDRWAVVAYIRALQLSQHAPVSALSDGERKRLEQAPHE